MNSSKTIFVFVENTYSSDGTFNVRVNVTNNSILDAKSITTTVTKI